MVTKKPEESVQDEDEVLKTGDAMLSAEEEAVGN